MIFSKIDKKVLVVLIIVILIILFAGFIVYKYTTDSKIKVQNSAGTAQTEQKPADNPNKGNPAVTIPQIQIQANGVQTQGGKSGGLSVCVDACGDGICQKADPTCDENSNLNCICSETPQECSKDCK